MKWFPLVVKMGFDRFTVYTEAQASLWQKVNRPRNVSGVSGRTYIKHVLSCSVSPMNKPTEFLHQNMKAVLFRLPATVKVGSSVRLDLDD